MVWFVHSHTGALPPPPAVFCPSLEVRSPPDSTPGEAPEVCALPLVVPFLERSKDEIRLKL